MAVILASEIKSEPLDQSGGSDYTRNCEPCYFVVFRLFILLLVFFHYIFTIFTPFFLPLMHCIFTQVSFSFTSKNHKNIFTSRYSFLFISSSLLIYLVVIFAILFNYHPHLMHYFISCHFYFLSSFSMYLGFNVI